MFPVLSENNTICQRPPKCEYQSCVTLIPFKSGSQSKTDNQRALRQRFWSAAEGFFRYFTSCLGTPNRVGGELARKPIKIRKIREVLRVRLNRKANVREDADGRKTTIRDQRGYFISMV